ncbi:MAG: cytochrome c3 family protein [Woeseiaceae bacterium]|jgi:hypothetical protein
MNIGRTKLGTPLLSVAAVFLSVLLFGAYANGELKEYSGLDGRSYHAELHEKAKCRTCHGVKEPEGYPEDGACLRCHEVDEIVAATLPDIAEDRWQNPHDNLHYGKDVPCVECHGEHSNKAPLCANCHNFEFSKHEY